MPANENSESRQQRQRALSDLAHGQEAATLSDQRVRHASQSHPLSHQKDRWRPRLWQAGVLVLVAIAVVVGAVVAVLHSKPSSTHTPQTAAPLELLPHLSGFDCPQDMAWSPNGTRVALIGYELQCPDELMQPEYGAGSTLAPRDSPINSVFSINHGNQPLVGLILAYDSNTGKLLLRAQPDEAIQKLFTIPASVVQVYASINETPEPEIHYTHVLWLPRTNSLAVTFTTFVPSGPPPPPAAISGVWAGTAVYGVVLADLNGGLHVLSATFPYPGPSRVREWDLLSGQVIALPPALASQIPDSSIAPGLAYQWGANGTLTVADQLPVAGVTLPTRTLLSPVATADGSSRFTIWQAGELNTALSVTSNTVINSWTADFATISPDGRYLLDAVSLDGQLQPEIGASPTALALPIRDAGLRQFLTGLSTSRTYGATNAAWRPDGQVFAVQKVGATGSTSPDQHAVLLFDCQTGALVTTLVPFGGVQATGVSSEPNLLTWSPDGSRLFLFDSTLGTATIWVA